jgi:eukaryotic-like serine/threonine-protein kinase
MQPGWGCDSVVPALHVESETSGPKPQQHHPLGLIMNCERLDRLNILLETALGLAPDARHAWIHSLPEEQRALVATLERMLEREAHETDDFMRRPISLPHEADGDKAGDVIGVYHLIEQLGQGGMACVWRARRVDGTLQREVALKLPHAGWARSIARRMERERDILASLEHPRIARLYDAGLTQSGRPWLAMELVEGVSIDHHVKQQGLSIDQRLQLFLQVADAVAYAHAQLVIHRDLKPSNVLVTRDGQVRLLDFGVAQLIQDQAPHAEQLTRELGRPVTPAYAAPEVLGAKAVGTAADVYSLGVLLYELLTGERPYSIDTRGARSLEDAVLKAHAPPMSTRVGHKPWVRALRGDLDTIVSKAMRKEPAERYRTVEAFAADIERHRAGRPVHARPYSLAERVRKTVARHRLVLATAAIVAAALLCAAALAALQAREAALERDQARALLTRNDAINEFFNLLFTEAVDPEHADAVKAMLDRGARMVTPAFGAVAENEATILRILASYHNHPDRSEALLSRAAEITAGSSDRTLRAQIDCDRGQLLEALGRTQEAVRLLERWISDPRTPDLAVVHCLQMRGGIAANRAEPQVALRSAQHALQRLPSAGLAGSAKEAELLGDIAFALHAGGSSGEAQDWFQRSDRLYRALNRQDSLQARVMLSNWGVVELSTGDVQRGLLHYGELLASHRRLMAWRDPPSWLLGNRALALENTGRWEEALAGYEETLRVSESAQHVQGSRYGLVGMASVLVSSGRLDEAEQMLHRAARLPAADESGHPSVIRAQWVHARLQLARGQAAQARARLGRQIEHLRSIDAAPSPQALMLRARAEAALALGEPAAAADDARQALTMARRLQGGKPHSDSVGLAWLLLGRAELAAGHAAQARAALQQAVEHLEATAGTGLPESRLARSLLQAAAAS